MRLGNIICLGVMSAAIASCTSGERTAASARRADARLRVLTLNLMQKSPVAGRDERFDTIVRFVKARREDGRPVDVLLLQEGCSGLTVGTTDSINDLRKKLAAADLDYEVCSQPCFGVPNFLVFRVGVLADAKILYSGGKGLECQTGNWYDDFPLPDRKRVVAVGIDHPIGRVNLFSTHLCSGGSAENRKRQAEELLQFIKEFGAAHPADLAVLGGDMNTWPDTDLYKQLAAEFTDSFAAAAPSSPGHTFNVPHNPHCQGYRGDPRRIDFIFVKGGGVAVEGGEVVFNTDDGWVSDHCGVLTTLRKTK